MKTSIIFAAALLTVILAAPVHAQDVCTDCPFDQGAELDAACPNGICNTVFVGGNYSLCYATAPGQYCYACGLDQNTREITCDRTSVQAACGCTLGKDKSGKVAACRTTGQCIFR